MKQIVWDDGLGSRSRRAHLWLIRGDEIENFGGQSISGWAVVTNSSYTKQGKWSKTTYSITLPDDVRPLSFMEGWDTGSIREGVSKAADFKPTDTWSQMADAVGVSVAGLRDFLRVDGPTAVHLDKVASELLALAAY